MNKIILVLVLGIFLAGLASAVGEISYCCEKTVGGAWCQNSPEEDCNQNFQAVPTSCEATSFCKLGCCYDSQEGTCMENTPQVVCNDAGGVWGEGAECEIAQCELGCCLIGEQAAFVTQTRCKRLSALYSLETNFRNDISNEIECIASATSDAMGACVFTLEYEKTCKMLSQKECKKLESNSGYEDVEFRQDYLCSAEELGTNCGPSQETTCVEGEDEIYFVDTCGNLANIYDSSKIKNKEYWTKIYLKSESCNPLLNNANSASCGNCDYYLGSTCKTYERGEDKNRPNYGDNICRDLSCEYDGEKYEHGESWCETNTEKLNTPGSEYYRMICYNGEVTIEPCASFRAEVCIESSIGDFSAAACRANRWQDCLSQDEKDDCENEDKRDCEWILSGEVDGDGENFYICSPKYAPGFDFWVGDGEAEEICSLASTQCTAKFEQGIISSIGKDSWKCVENCHCCVNGEDEDGNKYSGCTGQNYEKYKDEFCESLGDCGRKLNYLGKKGYDFDDNFLLCDGDDCYWTL